MTQSSKCAFALASLSLDKFPGFALMRDETGTPSAPIANEAVGI